MIGDAANTGDGPSGRPLRDPDVAHALRAGIAQKGPALLYAPTVLQDHLAQACPRAGADIAQLLIGLDEQVPQALLGVYDDAARNALTRSLAERLHDHRGLERDDAQWVVDTWAQALHVVPSAPLPFAADGPLSHPVDDVVAVPASRPFTAWRLLAGAFAIVIVAIVAIGGMQLWSASRSDPVRVLDALSTPPAVRAPEPVVAPATDATSAATVPSPDPTPAVEPVAPTPPPAPAPRASSIVDVAVPSDVVVGRRFVLTIRYEAGDRPPVAIERRVVQVGTRTVDVVRKTPLAALKTSEPGTLRYPVPGVSGAARRTYLFTLIDADGARSASTRATVDVAPAPASANASAPTCTRDTCGSVVSTRPVARGYELTVRMDDRSVRTITHASRIGVGRRVRWAGGRLTPLATTPAPRRTTK